MYINCLPDKKLLKPTPYDIPLKKKYILCTLALYLFCTTLFCTLTELSAQSIDLTLSREDLIIEESTKGGYDLWIRQKPGIKSVLLTESSNDPKKKFHIYALRTLQHNPVNGDEKRLINGKFMTNNIGIIDSTPDSHPMLGPAFHLFIPYVVEYGYPGARNGQIQVMVGTFLNIKTFAKPYGDWTGEQQDNPFVLAIENSQEQAAKPAGNYLEETIKEYNTIARESGGKAYLIPGNNALIDKIREVLEQESADSLDLVIALDTTLSMADELPYLKKELIPLLASFTGKVKEFRIGICFYRDYFEQYLTKPFAFTDKLSDLQTILDTARPLGGREIPEAVYEALNTCLDFYPWGADSQLILLIGDAPPHPLPHNIKITKDSVSLKAKTKNVNIHTFILSID